MCLPNSILPWLFLTAAADGPVTNQERIDSDLAISSFESELQQKQTILDAAEDKIAVLEQMLSCSKNTHTVSPAREVSIDDQVAEADTGLAELEESTMMHPVAELDHVSFSDGQRQRMRSVEKVAVASDIARQDIQGALGGLGGLAALTEGSPGAADCKAKVTEVTVLCFVGVLLCHVVVFNAERLVLCYVAMLISERLSALCVCSMQRCCCHAVQQCLML